jgi:hypothetical protein
MIWKLWWIKIEEKIPKGVGSSGILLLRKERARMGHPYFIFCLYIYRLRSTCSVLLYRYRLRQISGLIDIAASTDSYVIGQQLQRDDFQNCR